MNRYSRWLSLWLVTGGLAYGQYAVDWYTIDGGGGTSSGGAFALAGTIGQPDAGTLAGGSFTLQGGFWPGTSLPSVEGEVPTLSILMSGADVVVSWAPNTPGFTLESTENLESPAWAIAPSGNPLTVTASGSARYYRLRKP